MFWVLIIVDNKGKKKFVGALNYDKLMLYINKYSNVKKRDDYNFESDEFTFTINMVEMLDWRDFRYGEYKKGKKTWDI